MIFKPANRIVRLKEVINLACDEQLVRLVMDDGSEVTIMPYDFASMVTGSDDAPRKDEGIEDPDDLDYVDDEEDDEVFDDDEDDDDSTEFDDVRETKSRPTDEDDDDDTLDDDLDDDDDSGYDPTDEGD